MPTICNTRGCRMFFELKPCAGDRTGAEQENPRTRLRCPVSNGPPAKVSFSNHNAPTKRRAACSGVLGAASISTALGNEVHGRRLHNQHGLRRSASHAGRPKALESPLPGIRNFGPAPNVDPDEPVPPLDNEDFRKKLGELIASVLSARWGRKQG